MVSNGETTEASKTYENGTNDLRGTDEACQSPCHSKIDVFYVP